MSPHRCKKGDKSFLTGIPQGGRSPEDFWPDICDQHLHIKLTEEDEETGNSG